jgi:uncharacterized membrane protein
VSWRCCRSLLDSFICRAVCRRFRDLSTWDIRSTCALFSGIAKVLGAITLVVPGLTTLKEWAYAGFTFAWISAFIAHYVAKDGPTAFMPLVLLLLLVISYLTRPASRQFQAKVSPVELSQKS